MSVDDEYLHYFMDTDRKQCLYTSRVGRTDQPTKELLYRETVTTAPSGSVISSTVERKEPQKRYYTTSHLLNIRDSLFMGEQSHIDE